MTIRLLNNQDQKTLESYLWPHKAHCMFMLSNLKAAGIDYQGKIYEGEYFGFFDQSKDSVDLLIGVIVHYWNGNIMMHALNQTILEHLTVHLKTHTKRSIAGILGPNTQAELVIKTLNLSNKRFSINRNEGLYSLLLSDLDEIHMGENFTVVPAQEIKRRVLAQWIRDYNIEALGATNNKALDLKVEEDLNFRLEKKESWVLVVNDIPVSLCAFNARLANMVQVGPVWTPPESRNKGYARSLLAHILHQEKLKGTHQAILFTDHPPAIKVYLAIGFNLIGAYRLAFLEA